MPTTKSKSKRLPKWMTGPDRNAEARIQAAAVAHIRLVAPQLIVFAVKNESLHPARAVWTGVYPGMTDIVLVDQHCLAYFLETKTIDGVLSPDQKKFRDLCRERKYPWATIRNVNDAQAALDKFGIPNRYAGGT